jgi:hypothetical protein
MAPFVDISDVPLTISDISDVRIAFPWGVTPRATRPREAPWGDPAQNSARFVTDRDEKNGACQQQRRLSGGPVAVGITKGHGLGLTSSA